MEILEEEDQGPHFVQTPGVLIQKKWKLNTQWYHPHHLKGQKMRPITAYC